MTPTGNESVDYVISELSKDLKATWDTAGQLSGRAMDRYDNHIDSVAGSIRSFFYGPPPPPPPPRTLPAKALSSLDRLQSWMDRNRAWTAAALAFAATTVFIIYRSKRTDRKRRRARRAKTGAKTEVVILCGSPYSPLTKSLALDLERRGFLVYIPVASFEEEGAIAELRVADIHALNFDITSTQSTNHMLHTFSSFLANPNRHGTTSLHLASLILLPPYPSPHAISPTHHISAQSWSNTLNAHLLYPISLTGTFLPLLRQQQRSHPGVATSIVLLTPSTTPSLLLAQHAPESTTTAALSAYFGTLRTELAAEAADVLISTAHLRLGGVDFESALGGATGIAQATTSLGNDPVRETAMMRKERSRSASPQASLVPGIDRGTMRAVHNGVFDAVVGRARGTVFVGRGARTYAIVGMLAPRGLVGWLMARRGDGVGNRKGGQRRLSEVSMASGSGSEEERGLHGSAEWERVEQGLAGMSRGNEKGFDGWRSEELRE